MATSLSGRIAHIEENFVKKKKKNALILDKKCKEIKFGNFPFVPFMSKTIIDTQHYAFF